MLLKFRIPQPPKKDPEVAAKEFCDAIRKKLFQLYLATTRPEKLKIVRTEIHPLRDAYHRARGQGYGSRIICRADGVCIKVGEILNLNPKDWNNYRRGQQLRRLSEKLNALYAEWRIEHPGL